MSHSIDAPGSGSGSTSYTNTAIHDNVAGEIVAVTEKTSSVANDEVLIEDSADSNNKKSMKLSAMAAGVHGTGADNTIPLWNGTTGQLDNSVFSEVDGEHLKNTTADWSITNGTFTGNRPNAEGVRFISGAVPQTLLYAGGKLVMGAWVTSGGVHRWQMEQEDGFDIIIEGSAVSADRTQQWSDVAGDIAVYTGSFVSGTIPLLGDGAGGGVTGELNDSKLTQSGDKIIVQGDLNYANTQGLWFGDGNTGFYESADNTLNILSNNSIKIQVLGSSISLLDQVNLSGGNLAIIGSRVIDWSSGSSLDGYTLPSTSRSQKLPDMAGTVAVTTAHQTAALTAGGTAITVTASNILITSDNAIAANRTFTLATTGAQEGQRLTTRFSDATNQCEIAATTDNLTIGGATITFNAVGQRVEWEFNQGKWEQATALVAVA
jgi:uncharacterized cupin superfamily protein